MKKQNVFLILYSAGILISLFTGFEPGVKTAKNLLEFAIHMFKILPFVFILIGLFEVWVPKKAVEERLGRESGLKGHMAAFLLASLFAGGLYVSLPAAAVLYEKGASLDVVLTFIGASTLVRIPMMLFEVSFMGLKFTVARLIITVPLVIVSSYAIARLVKGR